MTIGLFWALFAGFIIGMLMNAFKPIAGLAGMKGLLITAGIGIAGALVLSFAGQLMHMWGREQLNAFIASIVGAIGLLAACRFYFMRRVPVAV